MISFVTSWCGTYKAYCNKKASSWYRKIGGCQCIHGPTWVRFPCLSSFSGPTPVSIQRCPVYFPVSCRIKFQDGWLGWLVRDILMRLRDPSSIPTLCGHLSILLPYLYPELSCHFSSMISQKRWKPIKSKHFWTSIITYMFYLVYLTYNLLCMKEYI